MTAFKALPLVLALFVIPACYLIDDDDSDPDPGPGVILADLQVDFTIDESEDPSLCSVYGIDHWVVEVTGPEKRTSYISCSDSWSTENDMLGLPEGTYTVTIDALDAAEFLKATYSTTLDLIDHGRVEDLLIDFAGADIK